MALTQVPNSMLAFDGGPLGMRNRIINGDMRISQRGTSFSTPTAGTYTLDRWGVGWIGAAPASVAQVSGPASFKNALQITGAASNTVVNTYQRIESLNCTDLSGETVTIQANISVSSAQTVKWYLQHPTASDNYASVTNIISGTWSATTTATTFTATITNLPSGALNGLQLIISPNNAGAFTSGTIAITGVQLEVGTVATPFERRLYGQELALCQRYFERSYEQGTATGAVTTNGAAQLPIGAAASYFQGIIPYVEKRAQPTVTFYDCAGNVARVTAISAGGAAQTDNNNVISTSSSGQRGGWIRIAALAGGTAVYHWVASAEL